MCCSTLDSNRLAHRPAGRDRGLHHDLSISSKQAEEGMPDELTSLLADLAEFERRGIRRRRCGLQFLPALQSKAGQQHPGQRTVRQPPDGQAE